MITFVESDGRIAADRGGMRNRSGRWATFQVGHHGGSASEVAADLGCDWQTVMDAVNNHGRALGDDPNHIDKTVEVGLDEELFCRSGEFNSTDFGRPRSSTSPEANSLASSLVVMLRTADGGSLPPRWGGSDQMSVVGSVGFV